MNSEALFTPTFQELQRLLDLPDDIIPQVLLREISDLHEGREAACYELMERLILGQAIDAGPLCAKIDADGFLRISKNFLQKSG
jgi:hypothetical protein